MPLVTKLQQHVTSPARKDTITPRVTQRLPSHVHQTARRTLKAPTIGALWRSANVRDLNDGVVCRMPFARVGRDQMRSLYQQCIQHLFLFTSLFSDLRLQRKRAQSKRTRSKVLILRPVDVTQQINNRQRVSKSTPLTIQILKALLKLQNVTSSAKKDTSTRTKAIKCLLNACPTLTERTRWA